MDFGTLKTRVEAVLGRAPSDMAYELVTSDVNNRLRVRSLQKTAIRHVTNEVLLPSDIKSIKSVKISGAEINPIPFTSQAFETEGTPRNYAITEGVMHLAPRPGQTVHFEGNLTPGASGNNDGWQDVSRLPDGLFPLGSYGTVSATPSDIFAIRTGGTFATLGNIYSLSDLGEVLYLNFLPDGGYTEWKFDYSTYDNGYYQYVLDGIAADLKAFFETYAGQEVSALVASTSGLKIGGGDLELVYYERLADLSADSDTNDILTNYPQVYVYGTLFHHHALTQNAEAASGYWTLFDRAMKEAERENNAALFGKGPIQPKVRSTP